MNENDKWQTHSHLMTCDKCMYFMNFRCRRHSPDPQKGWPAVFSNDFCGDHKLSKQEMKNSEYMEKVETHYEKSQPRKSEF